MGYENAIATKLLATNCLICGRPLVDAVSVERGVGPEYYKYVGGFNADLTSDTQKAANKLVFEASVAAVEGRLAEVIAKAEEVKRLGYGELAKKMTRRFVNAERKADIKITIDGNNYLVSTPFRRGCKNEFIAAWRLIPGRRYSRQKDANVIPMESKKALWDLLVKFFPGKYGVGPKGVFKVPAKG